MTGRRSEPFRDEDELTDLVCHCMHVREGTLRRAIDRGAASVEELRELTRAGTGCGTCRSELKRLLREHGREV